MREVERDGRKIKGRRGLNEEGKELVSRLFVLTERAEHGASDSAGVLFFNASHHHAEMAGFANYGYTDWVDQFLNGFRYLLRKAFLNLKAPREYVYQARYLA